jgi:hypothetical protein
MKPHCSQTRRAPIGVGVLEASETETQFREEVGLMVLQVE